MKEGSFSVEIRIWLAVFKHLCEVRWPFYIHIMRQQMKIPPSCVIWSLVITCFEGELVLFLAVVIIESADADPFPGAGVVFERIPVATVFVSGERSGLLVVGPLGRVSLIFIIAAHTGRGEMWR